MIVSMLPISTVEHAMILWIGTTVRAQSDLRDNTVKRVGVMESVYCIKHSVKPTIYPLDPIFKFGGYKSFLLGHWYPCSGLLVMSPLGFKARLESLASMLACVQWIPQIHFWCNTCWLLGSQHGNWAVSSMFHILSSPCGSNIFSHQSVT